MIERGGRPIRRLKNERRRGRGPRVRLGRDPRAHRPCRPELLRDLVLDLPYALGFRTSRSNLSRVGRSGDEGTDRPISLDRLGVKKVRVQAK